MSQLSEGRDLSQSRGGNPFVVALEFHFFHGDQEIGLPIPRLVDHAIGALAAVASVLLELLVSLHGRQGRVGQNVNSNGSFSTRTVGWLQCGYVRRRDSEC